MNTTHENPLRSRTALPRFDEIRPEHVEPGIRSLLAELDHELTALEAKAGTSWKQLVEPLERMTDRLERCWGVVGHLMGVRNSDELRTAHEAVQPEVVRFSMRLGQSRALYDAARELRDGPGSAELDGGQQRIVDSLVRDAELSGVGLEGEARERFNEIQLELAELSTQFGNHVLDATKAFHLELTEREEVAGLPDSALELAARQIAQKSTWSSGACGMSRCMCNIRQWGNSRVSQRRRKPPSMGSASVEQSSTDISSTMAAALSQRKTWPAWGGRNLPKTKPRRAAVTATPRHAAKRGSGCLQQS